MDIIKSKDSFSIPQLIEYYSSYKIYIEIICDAYKLDMDVCYRGCINYWKNDMWIDDDIGCYKSWQTAFDKTIEFAEILLLKRHSWI